MGASLTVDTFVLPARRPLLTSLRLAEALVFGNLHAPASARDDPHAHDAARRCRPTQCVLASQAALRPAQRLQPQPHRGLFDSRAHAREVAPPATRGARAPVAHLARVLDARLAVCRGALVSSPLPPHGTRSFGVALDGNADTSSGNDTRKPNKVGGIIEPAGGDAPIGPGGREARAIVENDGDSLTV
jgi:hypothetical protein